VPANQAHLCARSACKRRAWIRDVDLEFLYAIGRSRNGSAGGHQIGRDVDSVQRDGILIVKSRRWFASSNCCRPLRHRAEGSLIRSRFVAALANVKYIVSRYHVADLRIGCLQLSRCGCSYLNHFLVAAISSFTGTVVVFCTSTTKSELSPS
jgi:hypothetical protein